MNFSYWQRLRRAPRLLAIPAAEPAEQAARILSVQRNIVLPTRCMVVVVVFYYLFYAHLLDQTVSTRGVMLETLQRFFIFYIVFNAVAAIFLILRRFPPRFVQWMAFTVGFLDGILLAGLTVETGGFESTLYWVFPGLIILNALSIPLATPQIVLNLALSGLYLGAGLLNTSLADNDLQQGPLTQLLGSPNFSIDAIKDLQAFAARLSRRQDPVSEFLWGQFPDNLRQELSTAAPTIAGNKSLQRDLIEELNRVIHFNAPIYNESRFAGVALSEESRSLIGKDLKEKRLARFNRLLIEDAYPAEIIKKARSTAAQPEFMRPQPEEVAAVEPEAGAEPFLLRLIILWLLTASCYGVQLLAFRDRQAEEEAREAAARNSELKAAGRLAAEIAHQLKNPLGIINNAVFSLQRAMQSGKKDVSQQLDIIREEIDRSDRIITQLMGYAQLSEGRVEKLSVLEELDRALAEVFPPAASYTTRIHREYRPGIPALVMQRTHLSAAFVNLLQNAREAVDGRGNIHVIAHAQGGNTVEVIVADDGPGIPPEKLGRIFEAYFTSKSKGTGLGLAIVKHNVELYGGTVTVESKLGKGARFTLLFPVRTFA